ncbi:SDR family NAD(P)-dependent oxidoreductase [Streptomyces sp. NPDC026672]|uniref:SDR family NAD(P)-dependent oxidoreductase n=1 Tax=unclassified Streptomyces TaxID=2593676 RepID=UPI0033C2A87D
MTPISTPFDARTSASQILAGTDLTGRRIIVTGASGLGGETVRALAGAGAAVTILTRRPEQARPILDEHPQTEVAAVDLADLGSVAAFCKGWSRPVDCVVANAGVIMLPTRQVNAQGWELQLATNYLGHFALLNGLYDALRQSPDPRVVMVSSGAQLMAGFDFADPHFEHRAYDPFIAYAQSKTADALLAAGISRRWADAGITANACSPGSAHTALGRHLDQAAMQALGAMDEEGRPVTPSYFKTPEQAAATSVPLAASPLVQGVSGHYFEDNQEAVTVEGGLHLMQQGIGNLLGLVASWSLDPKAADALWDYALPVLDSVR